AAAIVIVAVGMYFWLAPDAAAATLGQVLENSEKAGTLHARYSRGKEQLEFWHTSKPSRSRWDDLAGNYRIPAGTNYWIGSEKAFEARRGKTPPRADQPLHHFLDLLGVPADRANLLAARPVERVRDGSRDVLVYRAEIADRDGTIGLEALVIAN